MNNIEATKQELKASIDRAIAAAAEFNQAIALLNLPELPPELADMGHPYNDVAGFLDGVERPIE